MEYLDKLKNDAGKLKGEIKTLAKALENPNGSSLEVGSRYAMSGYAFDDADIRQLLTIKIEKAQAKLAPLQQRLSILNELAAETLNLNGGE
ncbi:hypothetical protein [Rheinheimera sp. MMS21-TC3]|uniref:hypothetical protein n=1 Tax=Rheinheimera sp. MMS21-TC3 TaxID=3072790 RepID=UPI0028C4214E|nr:hypothetical protein [Rheinheimera sp. MMS21-TC3]WNO60412.1 hypothetical protein RDV63_05455 [Rheinheimera sp. MMS21-TC3]